MRIHIENETRGEKEAALWESKGQDYVGTAAVSLLTAGEKKVQMVSADLWYLFSWVFPSPCSILYTIIQDFTALLPEGSKITCIPCQFLALFLMLSDFSGFSNFLTILWLVDGEIPFSFALRNTATCPCSFSQSGEPHPIHVCECLSLSRVPFKYPVMIL